MLGHGNRFVGGPPNTQRTDPGGPSWQMYRDPYNDYAGPGSTFQSNWIPEHPEFLYASIMESKGTYNISLF